MKNLLIEILSEEIPPRLQKEAAKQLYLRLNEELQKAGFKPKQGEYWYGSRRLTAHITNLASISPDKTTKIRGPSTDASCTAIEGFVRKFKLPSIQDAQVETAKNGKSYYCHLEVVKGLPTQERIGPLVSTILQKFSWKRPMRWQSNNFQWIRPIKSIMLFLYDELGSTTIPLSIAGISASNKTYGHRKYSYKALKCNNLISYQKTLLNSKVLLEHSKRKEIIESKCHQLAEKINGSLISDDTLLNEIAGMVEYPHPILGSFNDKHLFLPQEIIIETIRVHQKCFCITDKNTKQLLNKFISVTDNYSIENDELIINGYQKVVEARLTDANFFFEADLKKPLIDLAKKLQNVIFHEKLGSIAERVLRIDKVANWLAAKLQQDKSNVHKLVAISKADLLTQMVGEFPSLQGLAGSYYARAQGYSPEICLALKEQYSPKSLESICPTNPLSVILSLADKVEILCSFWYINQPPTGSKDPFALRRSAISIIRLIIQNDLDISLRDIFSTVYNDFPQIEHLINYTIEKTQTYLENKGLNNNILQAIPKKIQINPTRYSKAAKNFSDFVNNKYGAESILTLRRAFNISQLNATDTTNQQITVKPTLFKTEEEKELFEKTSVAHKKIVEALEVNKYVIALQQLIVLHDPVEKFLNTVRVQTDDPEITANRLNIINTVTTCVQKVININALNLNELKTK